MAAQIDSALKALPAWTAIYSEPILRQYIDTALRRNFDIRLAMQALELSRAGIRFTRGIRLPEVGFAAGSGVRRFGEYTMDGVGNFDTQFSPNLSEDKRVPDPLPDYQVGLVSTWELDIYGKLKNESRLPLPVLRLHRGRKAVCGHTGNGRYCRSIP
jgi:outer membrane protein, multidrug efflux system